MTVDSKGRELFIVDNSASGWTGLRYGQPQASIAFLEIDHIGELLDRREVSGASANKWKYPPAGLNITSPGGSS